MKYVVEYRNEHALDAWTIDEEFDKLSDAIEHAAKECVGNLRMRHRIIRTCEPEEIMVFPSIERVVYD